MSAANDQGWDKADLLTLLAGLPKETQAYYEQRANEFGVEVEVVVALALEEVQVLDEWKSRVKRRDKADLMAFLAGLPENVQAYYVHLARERGVEAETVMVQRLEGMRADDERKSSGE
jgi:hypothetical protein